MTASIGVCVVFFNKAQQTIECIASFAKSAATVYVLNNGSDPLAAHEVGSYCSRLTNVIYFESPLNLGPAGGRNVLIRRTTEGWLVFADNDITVKTIPWLERMQAHIASNPDVDVLVPVIHNVWDGSLIRPARLGVTNGHATFEDPESDFTNLFPGGGAMVRRELFDRHGLYDEDLQAFEEAELALRAMRSGREIKVRHVHDIELLHDHRTAVRAEDRHAVIVRYDSAKVGRAHAKIKAMYGVTLDPNYDEWLREQVRSMMLPRWRYRAERAVRWTVRAARAAIHQARARARRIVR